MRIAPILTATTQAGSLLVMAATLQVAAGEDPRSLTYVIVDTGQTRCFGDRGQLLEPPRPGSTFYGQDAYYREPQASYRDNGDGTVSDLNTGLIWQKDFESGGKLMFQEAQAAAVSSRLAGHDDWRLPSAKELQSIVDYKRAPDARDPKARGPAIDPVFRMTDSEASFWTSTTHLEGPGPPGGAAAYIAFGWAMGYMAFPGSPRQHVNVHGAGAQRSDPKSGDPKSRAGPPVWVRRATRFGSSTSLAQCAVSTRNQSGSRGRTSLPCPLRRPAPRARAVPVGRGRRRRGCRVNNLDLSAPPEHPELAASSRRSYAADST